MVALVTICAIVLVILVMTSDARGGQYYFFIYRNIVATDALNLFVFPVQFEVGFIVIKIPAFPITGVMASLTLWTQCSFMNVFFFMARTAIRFGILEYNG